MVDTFSNVLAKVTRDTCIGNKILIIGFARELPTESVVLVIIYRSLVRTSLYFCHVHGIE